MKLLVAASKIHGQGVFAAKPFLSGEIVEVAATITFNENEARLIDSTALFNYYYAWGDGGGAIALGNGSLYNHSSAPNAEYRCQERFGAIVFSAVTEIKQGEEITIDYLSRAKPGTPLEPVAIGDRNVLPEESQVKT